MPLYACSNFIFIFFVVILIESNFDLVLTVNFKKWIDDDKEFKVDPLGWLKARFLKSFLKTAGNGFDTLVQILVSSVDFSKLLFKSPTTKACNKYGVEDFGDTNPDKTIAVFASFLSWLSIAALVHVLLNTFVWGWPGRILSADSIPGTYSGTVKPKEGISDEEIEKL